MNPFSGLYKKKILVNEPMGAFAKGVASDLEKVAGASQGVVAGLSNAGNKIAQASDVLPTADEILLKAMEAKGGVPGPTKETMLNPSEEYLQSAQFDNKKDASRVGDIGKKLMAKYNEYEANADRSGELGNLFKKMFGGGNKAQANVLSEEEQARLAKEAADKEAARIAALEAEKAKSAQGQSPDLLKTIYNAVWGDRSGIQRLGILGVLGHMATAGNPETKRNYLEFAAGGAKGAMDQERLNQKYTEEAAQKDKELESRKGMVKDEALKQAYIEFNKFSLNPSFIKDAITSGRAESRMVADGYDSKTIEQMMKDPDIANYYAYKAEMSPDAFAIIEDKKFSKIKNKLGGQQIVNAAPDKKKLGKQPAGDIQTDDKGVSWQINRDASGKPVSKTRI